MPSGKSERPNLRSVGSTPRRAPMFPALSVVRPSVSDMAEESTTRRLRVVAEASAPDLVPEVGADVEREAYWARLEELRAERARLLAG